MEENMDRDTAQEGTITNAADSFLQGREGSHVATNNNKRPIPTLVKRTSFGLSRVLSQFAKTGGAGSSSSITAPPLAIQCIDTIAPMSSQGAAAGGCMSPVAENQDGSKAVIGTLWRSEEAVVSTVGEGSSKRVWTKHVVVVRESLLIFFPEDTREEDLVDSRSTVRPSGFIRLEGANITSGEEEEEGEAGGGGHLQGAGEEGGHKHGGEAGQSPREKQEPPPQPRQRYLLEVVEQAAKQPAHEWSTTLEAAGTRTDPPVARVILACKSQRQASRWLRVLEHATTRRSPDHSSTTPPLHPHLDMSRSLSSSTTTTTSSHAAVATSTTTTLWHHKKSMEGSGVFSDTITRAGGSLLAASQRTEAFPFKEGHLCLVMGDTIVPVSCRLEGGVFFIMSKQPQDAEEAAATEKGSSSSTSNQAEEGEGKEGQEEGGDNQDSVMMIRKLNLRTYRVSSAADAVWGVGRTQQQRDQQQQQEEDGGVAAVVAEGGDDGGDDGHCFTLEPLLTSSITMTMTLGGGDDGSSMTTTAMLVKLRAESASDMCRWCQALQRSIHLWQRRRAARRRQVTSSSPLAPEADEGDGEGSADSSRRGKSPRPVVCLSPDSSGPSAAVTMTTTRRGDPLAYSSSMVGVQLSGPARVLVEGVLRSHFLFFTITDLDPIVTHMSLQVFHAGDVIIWQGEDGSRMYVVETGTVEVLTANHRSGDEASAEEPPQPPHLLTTGAIFGEVALLHNSVSNATVRVVGGGGGCRLWSINRQSFRRLLHQAVVAQHRDKSDFIRSVEPIFSSLTDTQVSNLASTVQALAFNEGDEVVVGSHASDEGAAGGGRLLYIIHTGQAAVVGGRGTAVSSSSSLPPLQSGGGDGGGGDGVMAVLGPRSYFGDRLAAGATAVKAITRLECYCLSKTELDLMLGVSFVPHHRDLLLLFSPSSSPLPTPLPEPVLPSSSPPPPLVKPSPTIADADREQVSIPLQDLTHHKTLGKGSFGEVVLVTHGVVSGGRCMALKILSKRKLQEMRQVKSVLTEKAILSGLARRHPFIVALYQTYSDVRRVYMLMEVLPGGELWTLLHGEDADPFFSSGPYGGLPVQAAAFYVAQCACALSFLHEACRVLYRDLKPENLCMDAHGFLKLVDFGFAKVVVDGPSLPSSSEESGKTWTICGTPEYLAPEIIQGKGYNRAVDLWSLGVMTYELLTLTTPFQDSNPIQVYQKVCRASTVLRRELDSHEDPALDPNTRDVIVRLLSPNPALRLGACASGMSDLWSHALFASWLPHPSLLESRSLPPPFLPRLAGPLDAVVSQNFGEEADDDDGEDDEEDEDLLLLVEGEGEGGEEEGQDEEEEEEGGKGATGGKQEQPGRRGATGAGQAGEDDVFAGF